MSLFDASVVGLALKGTNPLLPNAHRLQVNGDDPSSAAAEKARVEQRLGQAVQQAVVGAAVKSRFLATNCDDGIDNNFDGEIDCADEGCRQLAICDFTGVYLDHRSEPIPGQGTVTRTFRVGQEGRVRKLSLKIDVFASSPGDLAVTLVGPNGKHAVLRQPDRADGTWTSGYYVRDFNGIPAAGRWTLIIQDRYAGAGGMLRDWAMYVTS